MAPAGVVEALDEVEDRHAGLGLVRSAAPDGHVEGVQDQLGAQVLSHRPAHNSPGEGVQDHRQLQPASPVRCWV